MKNEENRFLLNEAGALHALGLIFNRLSSMAHSPSG
jgi:hypothetical protein